MALGFASYIAAAEKGAASVYHAIIGTGVAVSAWETAHPEVGALVGVGTDFANAMLARAGIPVGDAVAAEDVLASLKQLAAHDATVPSQPAPVAVIAALAPVIAALAPASAADPIAIAEEAASVAEELAATAKNISKS